MSNSQKNSSSQKTQFGVHQKIQNFEIIQKFLEILVKDIPKSGKSLEKVKNAFAAEHGIPTIKNRDIIGVAKKNDIQLPAELQKLIQKRAVRTISGVSPIGVLTKPFACPGKCTYCPTEDRMPKSYMKTQPAAARALRNNFDPFFQVKNRVIALEESGHPVSKLELIVMGGTWSFLPKHYQEWYITHLFVAANSFDEVKNPEISGKNSPYNPENFARELGYEENIHLVAGKKEGEIVDISENVGAPLVGAQNSNYLSRKGQAQGAAPTENFDVKYINNMSNADSVGLEKLEEQQKINETASHRIIGLTLETRPDFITEKELIRMRKYGCTRIEIGVQTLNDEVQKITKRGHDKKAVARAMKRMKDFGFKVCFHLMPGLPGSTPEKDLEMMKEVFENPDFRPDFIKIYPCMVLPTSELEGIWKEKKFTPISDQDLIQVLLKFKAYVPEWTRIMRFMRDIPAGNILDGSKFSNLRQILQDQPKKLREIVGEDFYQEHNLEENASKLFRDIRSREVGFSDKIPEIPVLKRRNYEASDGQEVFLSFESEDESQLFALLRLRKPSKNSAENISDPEISELFKNTAFIREVHSYGTELSVGTQNKNSENSGVETLYATSPPRETSPQRQQQGLGRRLIEIAEKIAREEWQSEKMTIIAGVGTREYYRKFGYEEKLSYMVKAL